MNYRELIVNSGLRMAASGLTVETWGNLSVRDSADGLVYLTPSAMRYDTIREEDVVVCTPEGRIVSGSRKPTVELGLHLGIYRARREVNAVIHTHPVYSMVYACQGRDIPLITDEAAQVLGDVCRTAPYALPGTEELARACAAALGERANACLLRSHGAVCVGESMDGAFKVCAVLEATARIHYMIEAAGGRPLPIAPADIAAMQDFAKNHYGQDKA